MSRDSVAGMVYARDTALIATPIGGVLIEGDEAAITAIRIGVSGAATRGSADTVRLAAAQIAEYFGGARATFDLRLTPARTPRGAVLRQAIVDTEFGTTRRYGEIALAIGSSARAIGQACRTNPFPIVVPCHRVTGGTGHYSAGDGLVTKNWLLDHERRHQEHING